MLDLTTADMDFDKSPTVTVTPTNQIKVFQSPDTDVTNWIMFNIPAENADVTPRTDQISITVNPGELEKVSLLFVDEDGTQVEKDSQVLYCI